MRALLYLFIAALLAQATPVIGNPTTNNRLDRHAADRRHWIDRDNDIRGYLIDRNSDGTFRYNGKPFVHASPPRAETSCKYVERIDKHGERSFLFICP
jgi:hypothetical protein